MIYTRIPTPVGPVLAVRQDPDGSGTRGPLTGLYLPTGRHADALQDSWRRSDADFDDVREQLREYFAGDRRHFDLPLKPLGSAFQQLVWTALAAIPYGTTTHYGAVAATIGAPKSARAVGMANALNPISIIVPCHRVIGANGALTGYGGGLDAKRWLLAHEVRAVGLFAMAELPG